MELGESFFNNPYPAYRSLAAEAPLQRSPFFGGAWVLARHRDIAALLRDERLSAERGAALVDQFPEEQRTELAEFRRLFSMWMLFYDPPRHTVLRRALATAFTAEALNSLRPVIGRIVAEILDQLPEGAPIDWIAEVAYPLPVRAICAMLGVPSERAAQFLSWSHDIAAFFGHATADINRARAAQDALVEITDYFRHRLGRLGNGEEDRILRILASCASADVTPEELASQCAMLLFAGHETTSNLIGNGLAALLRHPAELERLRFHPEIDRTLPDELLRYDSPVQIASRVARVDFELHCEQIRAGDLVIFLIGAANRDPEVFYEPERLDISRRPNPHLSFGLGPHLCLGLGLARIEAELLFRELVRRYSDIRMTGGDPIWNQNFGLRGLQELRLILTRANAQSIGVAV